jgi:hypothetical protein
MEQLWNVTDRGNQRIHDKVVQRISPDTHVHLYALFISTKRDTHQTYLFLLDSITIISQDTGYDDDDDYDYVDGVRLHLWTSATNGPIVMSTEEKDSSIRALW